MTIARIRHLLAQPATLTSNDWMLIATLLVEAYAGLENEPENGDTFRRLELDALRDEMRDLTRDFRNPAFLAATKAARKQAPLLFKSSTSCRP